MKKLLILMSILTLSIPAYAASFPDVSESDTYYEAIEFVYGQKIVSGNNDGTYAPERILNRAELMKIIAEGASTYFGWAEGTFDLYINSNCFDDVPAGEWFTKYICYGKEMGWVVGYEDGTLFKPSQEISFVEALKITYMGFGLEYTEGDEVWYKDVVEDASMYNYIPYTINSFEGGLQRDAMADLVTRIIKYASGELETYLGDRADIVVTYDTIKEGEDLSELIKEEVYVDNDSGSCEWTDGSIIKNGESYGSCICHNGQTFCGGSLPTDEEDLDSIPMASTPHTIVIDNMEFIDGKISIAKGDSITWLNNDSISHTVDIETIGTSGTISTGEVFNYTFNTPGTYNYVCGPHPSMTGTITVLEQ